MTTPSEINLIKELARDIKELLYTSRKLYGNMSNFQFDDKYRYRIENVGYGLRELGEYLELKKVCEDETDCNCDGNEHDFNLVSELDWIETVIKNYENFVDKEYDAGRFVINKIETVEIFRTSAEWIKENPPQLANITIRDNDGWDRDNFDYSYYKEKITLDEFLKRVFNSTLISNK